jgi:uncharacterized membrane protein YraQ (UPF0718 family)
MEACALLFLSLVIQGLPFLVAGALFTAVLGGLAPLEAIARRCPANPFWAAMCGIGAGTLIPSCECLALPLVRRFLHKGIPLPAALAYLLASPAVNPICLASTYTAYSFQNPWLMVAFRAFGSAAVALVLALALERLGRNHVLQDRLLAKPRGGSEPDHGHTHSPGGDCCEDGSGGSVPVRGPRWVQALLHHARETLSDMWSIIPLYILGALAASILQTFFPIERAAEIGQGVFIPVSMLLAVALSLCSSADAFVASSFVFAPLSAQLAFLWMGTLVDLKLLAAYHAVLKTRALILLVFLGGALVWLLARAAGGVLG